MGSEKKSARVLAAIELIAMGPQNVLTYASRVLQGFPKVEVKWSTCRRARLPKEKAECATPFSILLKKLQSDGVEQEVFLESMAVKLVLANHDVEPAEKVLRRYLPAHV
ncbi:MAG: hypothetical protein WBG34_08900 [Flavobacteriales bacterium]